MIYDKVITFWDNVFKKEEQKVPTDKIIGVEKLNDALNWLVDKESAVLDFGCGNGTFLFYAELRGAIFLTGIDLSQKAIESAKKSSTSMKQHYNFIHGGTTTFKQLESRSFDSVILSNIIDNLTYKDALYVLSQVSRVLKPDGKILLKINPFIEKEKYQEYNIKIINGDLLDDGLLLLNKPSEEWRQIITKWFRIDKEDTIYYSKHGVTNRLFLLKKK